MSENITWLPISEQHNLTAGVEYAYIVPGASEGATTFSITDGDGDEDVVVIVPTGMMIQPRSGYLHWTPASDQSEETYEVTIVRKINGESNETEITFKVEGQATAESGIYVAPDGNDRKNSGRTIKEPFLTLHKAAQEANPGDTIYLRGGIYQNKGFDDNDFKGNLARITNSGTKDDWITIRPHGNEYVKLQSDVHGIFFKGARYWRVERIELEGRTQDPQILIEDDPKIELEGMTQDQIDQKLSDWWEKKALELWWDETDDTDQIAYYAPNQIKGRGIALNSSYFIEIVDCIIHNFPGAGVSNNKGADITLSNSVIYNNTWWSTAGSHGFANSKPTTEENQPGDYKMTMTGNLVFGNQSSMISHVFSKGFVTLDIDEGNGLHMQNTEGEFFGAFLAENNLMIYNGKAGLGLNSIADAVICRNSFYQNAQAVERNAELSLRYPKDGNSISPNKITNNLFDPLHDRITIKSLGYDEDPYIGIKHNYTTLEEDASGEALIYKENVFKDPENLDFSSTESGYGVSEENLKAMESKIQEYGLVIKPAITKITPEYLSRIKQVIFDNWEDTYKEVETDEGLKPLKLKDPETGDYYYEDRGDYPRALET